MLKFAMMLQAIDRVTGPAKRIRASMAGIGQGARKVASDIRSGARSFEFYEARARRLRGLALGRVFQAIAEGAGKAARKIGDLVSRMKLAERAAKGLKSAATGILGKLGSTLGGFAKWGSAAAAGGGIFALFDLFGTASQFEQLQVSLDNTMGSAAKGKEAFAWIRNFAATTPYELAEVTDAFGKLAGAGLDAQASLKAAGDAAAGKSKPLMAAIEAVIDAANGSYERLREFDILAAVTGDKVALTYRKAGKEIVKTARKGAEVERTLRAIFTDRFGGMMEKQSTTFAGLISNLKDKWSEFLYLIAQAGIFDTVKKSLQGVLDQVNAMAADGRLAVWAKNISDWMKQAWEWAEKFINDTNWEKVGQDIQAVAEAALAVAKAIMLIVDAAKYLELINAAQGGTTLQAGPDPKRPSSGVGAADVGSNINGRIKSMMNGTWVDPNRKGTQLLVPKLPPKKVSANDTRVGGLIRVQVEAKPGTSVRTAALKSDNSRVPLQVNLGRVMAGAA